MRLTERFLAVLANVRGIPSMQIGRSIDSDSCQHQPHDYQRWYTKRLFAVISAEYPAPPASRRTSPSPEGSVRRIELTVLYLNGALAPVPRKVIRHPSSPAGGWEDEGAAHTHDLRQ